MAPRTLPCTEAPSTTGLPTLTWPSFDTRSTRSNETASPSFHERFRSQATTSPTRTPIWRDRSEMTANTVGLLLKRGGESSHASVAGQVVQPGHRNRPGTEDRLRKARLRRLAAS